MSSRSDHRRRERSWERDDRDRNRDRYQRGERSGPGGRGGGRRRPSRSRSRSPPRRGDRDYRGADRRDHGRDRDVDRRDRGGRDAKRDYGRERDRDGKRDAPTTGGSRELHGARPREPDANSEKEPSGTKGKSEPPLRLDPPAHGQSTYKRPNLDPDATTKDIEEEGEAMEATNEDDAKMMGLMGLTGFGSTKGKPVEGNQEGAVDVKKIRTWRQYMNRRGGFNRPLDKIK